MSTPQAVLNGQVKLGVLGGGQLGKMMALAAGPLHLPYYTLDRDKAFPAVPYSTHFVAGDFRSEEDVLAFGRQVDVLTIEIEHVHTGALHQLQAEGVTVHPDPAVLEIIKDKGLQKLFYQSHDLPTSDFDLYPDEAAIRAAVAAGELELPFVQKARTGGYDGRGVALIQSEEDLRDKLLPGPALIEQLVDIDKELAVVVARNERGEIKSFPVVEMVFDPTANLVDYLLGPAQIPTDVAAKATLIAEAAATAFRCCGLLAVELFLTQSGQILINEVAPRPHNSGHHTIESCVTSQFAQHLRGVLNLPLGDTRLHGIAAMLNILGEPGHTGPAHYQGLDEALAIPGVYAHLYGKTETRPFRKMGHLTVLGQDLAKVQATIQQLKSLVKCIAA
ncbi:MAG: 5-(carboxyamino)imidazole ribonucleotide synthase [Bacteroidetes bacterium]|nr:MAG: 5-(carboxyamino)imidazole ribonucleotide synthase [Bacteroidota bacterium]